MTVIVKPQKWFDIWLPDWSYMKYKNTLTFCTILKILARVISQAYGRTRFFEALLASLVGHQTTRATKLSVLYNL